MLPFVSVAARFLIKFRSLVHKTKYTHPKKRYAKSTKNAPSSKSPNGRLDAHEYPRLTAAAPFPQSFAKVTSRERTPNKSQEELRRVLLLQSSCNARSMLCYIACERCGWCSAL